MSDKEQRREAARQRAKERQKAAERDDRINQKRTQARGKAPEPEEVKGPPWNTAVLLYLEAIDERLERLEDALGIMEGSP